MGRKHTGYCLNISSTFGAITFSCAVQGYLSSTLKQKLYQESDSQQNVEAFKNWQSLTATLPSQPLMQKIQYILLPQQVPGFSFETHYRLGSHPQFEWLNRMEIFVL